MVLHLPKTGQVVVYSNQKVLNALGEIEEDLNFYKGVRLLQVIEAVYAQGQKDGIERVLDARLQYEKELEKLRPRKIGRPRKAAAAPKKAAGTKKAAATKVAAATKKAAASPPEP